MINVTHSLQQSNIALENDPSFTSMIYKTYQTLVIYHSHSILLGITCTESGGLSSKNRSILYRLIPLGWVPLDRVVILYRAQGVKLKVGGPCFILRVVWCMQCWGFQFCTDFHLKLDLSQCLGAQILYYAKNHTKIKPWVQCCQREAWGP